MRPRRTRAEKEAIRQAAREKIRADQVASKAAERAVREAAVRRRENDLLAEVAAMRSKLAERGEPFRLRGISVVVKDDVIYVTYRVKRELHARPLGPLAGAVASFEELEPREVYRRGRSMPGAPGFPGAAMSVSLVPRQVSRATVTVTAGGKRHQLLVEGEAVPTARHQADLLKALIWQARP